MRPRQTDGASASVAQTERSKARNGTRKAEGGGDDVGNDRDDALIFQMGLYKAVLPKRLLYARSHFWFDVSADGTKTRCGLTLYAVRLLSDLFRIEWRVKEGEAVAVGELLGDVESVKAVSELYAPMGGTLVAVNADVVAEPSLVNLEPYGAWLLEFAGTPDGALQAAQYVQHLESEWENTAKLFKGQAQ
jgi:glycine cleavage system H protein